MPKRARQPHQASAWLVKSVFSAILAKPTPVGLAKDCSRVVGRLKSHFRGIKQYYLLAIVRSRIFKNGANAQTGAMQLWSDFGKPWLPVIQAFLEVLFAITIKCTWSSVDDISKPVLAPG
ncbi:hypothetical protein EMIT0P218_170063 [Pseudomonas sp. IT-P218]